MYEEYEGGTPKARAGKVADHLPAHWLLIIVHSAPASLLALSAIPSALSISQYNFPVLKGFPQFGILVKPQLSIVMLHNHHESLHQ